MNKGKIVQRLALCLSMVLLGVGLAACIDNRPMPPVAISYPQPLGVEGDWVDSNGIHSSFQNGYFETRATDTQEKLSEGNYVMRSQDRVDIEIHSLVRGTVSRVNCAFNGPEQLQCRSPEGATFTLYRHRNV